MIFLVKSRTREGPIDTLRKVQYKLRMNPKKCVFDIGSGKLLGFIVNRGGIKIDPIKVRAIVDMPLPKNMKELRGFLGWL